MLDVCLLGTGGMMPLPYRFLTALAVRYNGSTILIDCGEGTQIALRKKGWSPKPIDYICFTHFHADHISGLPGMLLNMGNAEKTEPLTLIGPKGLTNVVNSLRVIAPDLPFPVRCLEIDGHDQDFSVGDLTIRAFRVHHNVPCYGYQLALSRQGKFDLEAAEALGLDKRCWNRLQKGETVEAEGKRYTPDMVMGPPRKGLKLVYTTDTRPTRSIIENAENADLFICEGMYGEPDSTDKAKEHKHMNFIEAAMLARKAAVRELWLTHYSPSLLKAEEFMPGVREIFPNAHAGKDGKSRTLRFPDDDRQT